MSSDRGAFQPCLIATLNLLGDDYNPFQFIPLQNSEWISKYQLLLDKALDLTWNDISSIVTEIRNDQQCPEVVHDIFQRLKDHCRTKGPVKNSVWSFLTENGDSIMGNNNKIVDLRINMLEFAMAPLSELPPGIVNEAMHSADYQQWNLGQDWEEALRKLIPHYGRDALGGTIVFDIVANVIANAAPEPFADICRISSLNPSNTRSWANNFLGALAEAAKNGHPNEPLPVIFGLQEWPSPNSLKSEIFAEVLASFNYRVISYDQCGAASVAVVYSASLGEPELLTGLAAVADHSIDPTEVMTQCIESQEDLTDKDKKGFLSTTARKTMIVRFRHISAIVVHAKEPKTESASRALAMYIKNLGGRIQGRWVAMCDTNMASAPIASAFNEVLGADGSARVMPSPQTNTTAKHRSMLHGQMYDTNKCLVTVKGPKDRIVASHSGTLQNVRVYPEIEGKSTTISSPGNAAMPVAETTTSQQSCLNFFCCRSRAVTNSPRSEPAAASSVQETATLPTSAWATDHCLVTAVLSS